MAAFKKWGEWGVWTAAGAKVSRAHHVTSFNHSFSWQVHEEQFGHKYEEGLLRLSAL